MVKRIPSTVIEEIRSKTNIVEVVGQYVQLKKSGKNYSGLCPFHEEKTPSFSVAEDKQIFHCFGCGKGGNVFSFIQEIEGLSFPEAVVKVADLESIPMAQQYQEVEASENTQSRQLIELHEKAVEVFHHMLIHTAAGQGALDYLLERGLTQELIETFQIGFAPNERHFLGQIFQNEKVPETLYSASGLFVEREDGTFADRFYQRIMFPIRNPQGKTIGFSGRFLPTEGLSGKEQPKYLNSPETELFNKRDVLFNFDKARSTIRKESTVFLFEGFMDVLAAWQAGIQNGIASMGTSLTNQQITAIERVAKELVICYDGDTAGVEATNRAIGLMQEHSRLRLTIVSLPERLDPDEYVQKYGVDAFQELAYHGRDTVFSFKMMYHRLHHNLQNEKEQLDYVQELLKELTKVDSLIEQDRYLTQLSTEFHISRETLQQQFRQFRQDQRIQNNEQRQPTKERNPAFRGTKSPPIIGVKAKQFTQLEKAERLLLYRLFNDPFLNQKLKQQQLQFVHERYQEIYFLYDTYVESTGNFLLPEFLDFLKDQEIKNIVIEIAYLNVPEESSDHEINYLLQIFKKAEIADEITKKRIQQQEASQKGNQQLELELAVEIINLTKKMKQAELH
ncbi:MULTISPECIES: DNA primase [Enterococcus]|uniref:DNA primase n=1 Tax=Enterococcus TaxID=1350 RepID=UPI00065DFC39|nr:MULTISPECIES: DNA primase [Enterococcus]KAF1304212.1 DNA primase [Enterococcus sp. JM9B]